MASVSSCSACPDSVDKTEGRWIWKGKGPTIMVVAEYPEEEERGKAYSAGPNALIVDLMKEAGLDKFRVYVTYAVKCRPARGKLKAEHLKPCLTHLSQETQKINPDYLVPLGNHAFKAVGGQGKITDNVGVLDNSVLPMFSPKYLLHREGDLPIQRSAMLKLRTVCEGGVCDPGAATKVELVTSLSRARELFESRFRHMTAFDLETAGVEETKWDALDHRTGYIRTIGLCDEVGRAFVFPVDEPGAGLGPEFKKLLAGWLEGDTPKVAHNAQFEYRWLIYHVTRRMATVDDTKAMAHLMDENSGNHLSGLTCEYIPGMAGYDDPMKRALSEYRSKGEGYSKVPLDQLFPYNGQDCDATLRLCHIFHRKLTREAKQGKLSLYREAVRPAVKITALFALRGMAVDSARLEDCYASMKSAIREVEKRMEKLASVKKSMAALGNDKFNSLSPKQVGHLLFRVMKLRPPKLTNEGNPSASEEALSMLPNKPEVAHLMRISELRGQTSVAKQYVSRVVKGEKRKDGVELGFLYGDYSAVSVATGRLSCRDPNLMAIPGPGANVPVHSGSCFISRHVGGKIVRADYSQLELRLIAECTHEPSWVNGFQEGGFDPHQLTADRLGIERSEAKRVNFGVVYGIHAPKLAIQIGKSKKQAQAMLDQYWAEYEYIDEWFSDQKAYLMKHGRLWTPGGRTRTLPDAVNLPKDDPKQWRAERQGPNAVIQGFAADIVEYAMAILEQELQARGMESLLVNQVHDALYVDCTPDEVEYVMSMMRELMVERVNDRFSMLVPLEIDMGAHDHLAEEG